MKEKIVNERNDDEKPQQVTVRLPAELSHELKKQVVFVQRKEGAQVTMNSVLTRGVEMVLEELKTKYGAPPRNGGVDLRKGRRIQSE